MNPWTNGRKASAFILCLLLISEFFNSLFVFISQTSTSFKQDTRFNATEALFYITLAFLTIPILSLIIKLNRGDVQSLGVDQYYLLMFAVASVMQLYYLPYTLPTAVVLIYIVPLLFEDKINVGPFNTAAWVIGSISVLFSFVYLVLLLHTKGTLGDNEHLVGLFVEVVPRSIYEELIFRGMLFSFLCDSGFSRNKSFTIQGVMFWLMHLGYSVANPLFFWIAMPVISLILTYIVMRTKSLALSSVAHIFINLLLLSIK
jgi:membrane protease YdiL (CAAX protease family)